VKEDSGVPTQKISTTRRKPAHADVKKERQGKSLALPQEESPLSLAG
jgi:hypothetical protein